MDFHVIKQAVAKRFAEISQNPLFRVASTVQEEDGSQTDTLWPTYLGAFRKGDNPIFRERAEHDCSCCRQFVRNVGGAVAIVNGRIETIWDISIGDKEPGYQIVADAMAAYVRSLPIKDQYLHYEPRVGQDKSFEQITGAAPKTWEHFAVTLPSHAVAPKDTIPTKLGKARSTKEVFLRGLKEINPDDLDGVLDLIAQNSLYRGEEHKHTLLAFREQLKNFWTLKNDTMRDRFAWVYAPQVNGAVAHIRNTSIGTLLVELSEGMDLVDAVNRFEAIVAGPNYKRPTALVTPVMVERAKNAINDLGLTSALDRRFATLEDISVNDVLFADRGARKTMKNGGVFDDIATPKTGRVTSKIEEIPIAKFLADVLPRATSLEVMFENRHVSNLVSLIAPNDPTAGQLFKWDNPYSWAYTGDMADSIKERVKQAGGSVEGDLCCRLAWYNYDDLDFHMHEPSGGHINFRNKRSYNGGALDVDMNAGMGRTREPVENIFYASKGTMESGTYRLRVHQFSKRESIDVGFEVEIDVGGTVHTFSYDKAVRQDEYIDVAFIKFNGTDFVVEPILPSSTRSRKIWGLDTQQFQKVNLVSLSPNYWNGQGVGNKHYMFMLADCVNDGTARGFFNEFLRADLNEHRKVLEIVGSKVRTQPDDHQLSGLGFSSTQRNSLICRVGGSFQRTVKVLF